MSTCFFWLCVINKVFILQYSSYWRVPITHYLCRKSHIRIFQSKCLSPWMGCTSKSQKRGIQVLSGVNAIRPLSRDKFSSFDASEYEIDCILTYWCQWYQYPLLTKKLQFCHLEIFSQYFPILAQLPIEQSFLVIHGHLIEGSGLVQVLTENKFSMIELSPIVDVNNIKRARQTLQITLCTLFIKIYEAVSVSETDFSS